MKNSVKRILAVFMTAALLMITVPFAVSAVATTYNVATWDELEEAVQAINTAGAGDYTISLDADITGNGGITFNQAGEVVTIEGNGHTFYSPVGCNVAVDNGAVLNLGDGETALTLKGGVKNDDPGVVHVRGTGSVCNMYDKVTIKDHKGSNYLGGGVTIDGGTFHMYGGTIKNCGISSGSVCYGGGVAVFAGGSFIMDGGIITECYTESSYTNPTDNKEISSCGGGVFVSAISSFTMNGGTISKNTATNTGGGIACGGGVALIISNNEMSDFAMGNPQSTVTINNGTITGNSADLGGGVFASGYYKAFVNAIGTATPSGGAPQNPGLYINGGEISANTASEGGGIFAMCICPWLRGTNGKGAKTQIHNATIKNNNADNGAGIESYAYWTQMDIDGCTITDNSAASSGGGIALLGNGSSGLTRLKSSTVTGNISGEIGAGVYYDADSRLYISGANTIQNNTYNGKLNNLNILDKDYPVYVNGDLTGSQIGLSDPKLWDDGMADEDASAVSEDYLTSGYKTNNSENPETFFTSDHLSWTPDFSDVNTDEVRLVRKPVEYLTKTTLTKTYKEKTGYDNAGSAVTTQGKLAENVVFTITPYKSFNRETAKTDIPAFGTLTPITVGSGSDEIEVTLPDYTNSGVGDYWYEVKETAGSSAGVAYDTNTYYMHVVVTRDDLVDPAHIGASQVTLHKTAPGNDGTYTNNEDDKTAGFTNEFSAGSLTVEKKISGNFADREKKFDIVVTLTAPSGRTVTGDITYTGSNSITGGWTGSKNITLSLGMNESVTFENIPDGATYTVKENDYSGEGYDVPAYTFDKASETGDAVSSGSWSETFASGTVSDSADTVTVENIKTATIDVGVILENAPFVLIILGVIGLGVFMFARRRKPMDD